MTASESITWPMAAVYIALILACCFTFSFFVWCATRKNVK